MTEPVGKQKVVDPIVIDLLKAVQRLTDKVSQLETVVAKINADATRNTRGHSSSTKGATIVARLNESDGSLPLMNMDAFIDFLTQMPYEVENILSDKPVDVVAHLVTNGCKKLRTRHNDREGMVLPITSFTECPNMLFIFDTEWRICLPALFSQIIRRFHLCLVTQCDRWREKNVGPPRPLCVVTSDTPRPARDPRAMAKHQKISAKIYSLNMSSARFISRTKNLVCTATVEDIR